MAETTPKKLAFILAILLSFMAAVIFVIFEVIVIDQHFWLLITGTFILLIIIQYLLLRYALEKFIYNRIKLVYKAIHKQKLNKDDKKEQITSIHGDIIGKVNEEVESWANDRKEEIDELKKMEVYRREFLGNVSHELKTPLFNMQGFILTRFPGKITEEH
jgi:two-component system phosphate regulon sensor histidine kinase PhoR